MPRLPAFALGFSASFFQLLYFREWLSAVSANEITLSVLLSEWLLLTGLAAWAGRKWPFRQPSLSLLLTITALLPPATLAGLRLLRNLVFTRGAEPDFLPFLLFSLGLSLPFCCVSGFALTRTDRLLRESSDGSAYLPDTLGGAVGGFLFAFIFFRLTDPFLACMVPVFLPAGILFIRRSRVSALFLLAICAVLLRFPIEKQTLGVLFQEGPVKSFGLKDGMLRVFGSGNTLVIRQNSSLLYASHNPEAAEELAHIPLLQRRTIRQILVLSGTLSGVAEEALKHAPEKVVIIEVGPEKRSLGREAGIIHTHPAIQYRFMDPRRFVETTPDRFDAVLIAAPVPTTLSSNRYYTAEFFAACRKIMTDSGVVAFALPGVAAALGPETREALALCRTSLGPSFGHILFFPGTRTIVAASNGPLYPDLGRLLAEKPLNNRFLTTDRLAGDYSPFRLDMLNQIPAAQSPNRDFRPRLFFALQKLVAKEFNLKNTILPVLPVLLFLLFLLWKGRGASTLFTTAFASTGAEILLLTAFEIRHGTLYYAMSFLFALFLLSLFWGFALGARKRVSIRVSEVFVLLPLLTLLLPSLSWAGPLILPCLILAAFTAGFQFAQLLEREPAAFPVLFAADLAGGAWGALLTGTLLFPLLGFEGAAAVFTGMKIISLIR